MYKTIRSDNGQRGERTRSAAFAARKNKGHPLKRERQARANERLALHIYNPETCGKNCPKK